MESAGAMHVRMQQSGYTKFPCFLCLWDSRAKSDHWIKTDWPEREDLTVGKKNVINIPLVNREKNILPLHIKQIFWFK
jgi:hypothetical protein